MSNSTRSPVTDALLGPTEAIESNARLDPAAARLGSVAMDLPPAARSFLGGDWLGHALHPAMTDLPIGCWTSSMMLDFLGGRGARTASQRLTGWGVVLAIPTLATGLIAYSGVEDDASKRIGVVHAVGNGIATAAYVESWRRRRAGHHGRGVMWGLVGATAATVAGYLGGHLAFADPTEVDEVDSDQHNSPELEGDTMSDSTGQRGDTGDDTFLPPEEKTPAPDVPGDDTFLPPGESSPPSSVNDGDDTFLPPDEKAPIGPADGDDTFLSPT